MKDVGVRELRQNLSVWLRRVQDGETFRVTERGRPVALLRGLEHDDEMADLVAAGVTTPAADPDTPALNPLPARPGGLSGSAALQQLRDEEDR